MKWSVICILCVAFTPLLLRAAFLRTTPDCWNDPHSDMLSSLVINEWMNRFPRMHSYSISKRLPQMSSYHSMTEKVNCCVKLNEFRTETQETALEVALPFLQAYVDALNNIKEIRPYLLDFPYPLDKWAFILNLSADPRSQTFFPPPYIARVEFYQSMLSVSQYIGNTAKYYQTNKAFQDVYTQEPIPPFIQAMTFPRFDNEKIEKKISDKY